MNKSNRIPVVVGDVHGCIDELKELLKTIQYNKSQIRLVFLGDLVHRGPSTLEVVRKVRELDVECIMGNHEDKLLRWRKHEAINKLFGKKNPMKAISDSERIANESLLEDDLTWMQSLPLKLNLGNNWWAVHAGVEPRFSLDRQSSSQIMRVRFVNQEGVAQSLNPDKSQPEGTVYWTEQWKGPENIVYGHCVHDLEKPRYDFCPSNAICLGIDTGCCFGGHLTAVLFRDTGMEFVQVKAKRKYSAGHGDE
jgi:bis(5'-nucleosyl)-tetraphosphatase (symmetrical)